MALFIEEDWQITNLAGHRLPEARRTGSTVAFAVNPHPDRPHSRDVPLFLRVTAVGLEPAFPHQAWLFRGFVSDRFAVLDSRRLDDLSPDRVQFVDGMVYPGTDQGSIRPGSPQEARVSGAEEWLVEAGRGMEGQTVGRVTARSEIEAADLIGFDRGPDQGTYVGRVTPNGSLLIVRFKRVRDLPMWPPTR